MSDEKQKGIIFKKYHFASNAGMGRLGLNAWLSQEPMIGRESRERSKFIRMIQPELELIDEGIKEIIDRHTVKRVDADAPKPEDGKEPKPQFVYVDKDGNETFDKRAEGVRPKIDDQKAADKEIQEFMDEDLVVNITPNNLGTLLEIHSILKKTEFQFSGAQATLYDEWCEAFEAAEEHLNYQSAKGGRK